MFSSLTNFSLKRTPKQAFGFYLAYFLLSILVGGLLGGIGGLVNGDQTANDGFNTGLIIGQYAALAYCLGLTSVVINSKKLWSKFSSLILVVLSGLLSLFLGSLAGLIPAAFLTTKPQGK